MINLLPLSRQAGRCGGLVAYASTFLAQFYATDWSGALVVAAAAAVLWAAGHYLLRRVSGGKANPALSFLPVIALMLVYSRYVHSPVAIAQLLTAVVLAAVYSAVGDRRPAWRAAALVALSAAGFYLSNGGVALLALLCALQEVGRKRGLLLAGCWLLVGAGPLAYANYSYEIPLAGAYAPLLDFTVTERTSLGLGVSTVSVLAVLLVASVPLVLIWTRTRRPRRALLGSLGSGLRWFWWAATGRRGQMPEHPPAPTEPSGGWTLRSAAIVLIVGVLAAHFGLDRKAKAAGELHYAARQGDWKQVLDDALRVPPETYDMYVMKDVNTALWHTGRLPYEMFHYPEEYGSDSILLSFGAAGQPRPTCAQMARMFYDLGLVNEAEHLCHESLEVDGPSPEILKKLAMVNLLKDRPEAAKKFLRVLERTYLLWRPWAQERLRRVERDPRLEDDEALIAMRVRMPSVDYSEETGGIKNPTVPLTLRQVTRTQLEAGTANRLLFEHMMAYYLLKRDLDGFVGNMVFFDALGYTDLPADYEDAILLFAERNPEKPIAKACFRVSDAAKQRRLDCREVLKHKQGAGPASLREQLIAKCGHSYLVYYYTGSTDSRFSRQGPKRDAVTGATQ
jgi:hypothetical protein